MNRAANEPFEEPAVATPVVVAIESGTMVAKARAVAEIVSQEGFERAGEYLTRFVKPWLKRVDETFDPLITEANAHTANLRAFKKEVRSAGEAALGIINDAINEWLEEQERIRQIEEMRLAEEAQKERDRAAMAEAELLASQGDTEEAERVLEEAVSTPPIRPAVAPPAMPTGVYRQETWSGRCDDLAAAIKAAAEGKIPVAAFEMKSSALNNQARIMKAADIGWPGCVGVPNKGVRSRAR